MKYFIITYGCQMNHSDSERIAAKLNNSGHKLAKAAEQANLFVINACSVRESAMHRVYAKINQIKNLPRAKSRDKKIILAGCVLEADRKKLQNKISEFWHPDDYFHCQSVRETFSNSVRERFSRIDSRKSALIPIMTGCNNFCSYCVVPYTRGQEKSRPANKIIKEVKSLVKNGCKEIVLLGQNVNSYISPSLRGIIDPSLRSGQAPQSRRSATGLPRSLRPAPYCAGLRSFTMTQSVNFPRLLRLLNALHGNFTIKFLTSHPKDMSDELIHIIAICDKISKEIHLPIQNGDNTILKKMNRKYTVARYKKLIKKIRQKMPAAIISTDVIVGFPGETKKQFQNTVKLFKEIKFNKAYIAMYSPRPGTMAYKLKDNIPQAEKKQRWLIIEKIANHKR